MMSHRILPAVLLLCTLAAACGESPTGSDARAEPAGPAYDGGFGVGSGNNATESGSGADDTTETSTATETSDTTERGGFGVGSGN